MTKYIIITFLFFILGIIFIVNRNNNFEEINAFWQEQERICGQVGYYQDNGNCVPVEALR